MKDIAAAAGVSRGAASFALNDRPGVSEETRARVKRIAEEMGWTPSPAALALSSRRARAVGLVIARHHDSFAAEGFFLRLISGIEQVLQPVGLSLVLQVVPDAEAETQTLRNWWAEGRVDGVVLVDPRPEDPRPALLAELGLASVVIGGPAREPLMSGLVTDDEQAMRVVVDHLGDQGHAVIAYVSGLGGVQHTHDRMAAVLRLAQERGMTVVAAPSTEVTEDAGLRETEALLSNGQRPSAIIYDNEVLALGGLAAVHRAGLRVPDDVALVSCEDSIVCRVVQPAITALVRDPAELGSQAARMLVELVGEGQVRTAAAQIPALEVRGSSRQ